LTGQTQTAPDGSAHEDTLAISNCIILVNPMSMRPPNSVGVVVTVVVVSEDELDSVLMLDFLFFGFGRFSSSMTPASWLLRFFANLIPQALQSLHSSEPDNQSVK